MRIFLILFLLIPSLSWSLIFETDGFRCAGDDNGKSSISGLAYCEEGDTKFYGEIKENTLEGIVYVEAADNSIYLSEFKNDRMDGIGIQIKDNHFTFGQQLYFVSSGWNITVNDIKSDDIQFDISYYENDKQIGSYPSIKLKFVGADVIGRFFFFDEKGYCRNKTFSGSFNFNLANSFDDRSGYLGKVDKNCKFNGPIIQLENGKIVKYATTNNGRIESELSEKEFSSLYGKDFDEFNNVYLKLRYENVMKFLSELVNFSNRVKNIGIQDFSSNYFLVGSQEKIYKKFDKYISEFYE